MGVVTIGIDAHKRSYTAVAIDEVARAALREPDLPVTRLDESSRRIGLLVDHRDDLVGERSRRTNRLRWHLHERDSSWDPKPKCLSVRKYIRATQGRLAGHTGLVAEIATGIL